MLHQKVRVLQAWALGELSLREAHEVRTSAEVGRLQEAAAVWGRLDAEQVQREAHLPRALREETQLERERGGYRELEQKTAAVWANLHATVL